MTELTCRQVVASLIDYSARDLEPTLRHAVEEHFVTCDACVIYFRNYEQTTQLCQAAYERPD